MLKNFKLILPRLLGRTAYPNDIKKIKKLKKSKFGIIKSSLFSYITPQMIVVVLIVGALVYTGRQTLYGYYSTSVGLNSLIITIIVYSAVRTFYNNYLLWGLANFVKQVGRISEVDNIGKDQIKYLQSLLHTKGHLIDTKQMAENIAKIEDYGQIQFNDQDARIIKSKLGFRARINMSDVSFLAGILVMLGLLGTFLGLLKTIDAVSQAMASMGNIGGGGDMEKQMSGFITSLSKPLQGMGVAFSSSLFGLSGSLFVGVLNHLAGASQNTAIESISRWIDENIPKLNPKMKKLGNDKSLPAGDDLKGWLASFVFLSNKMNKRLGNLFDSISDSDKASAEFIEQVCSYQLDMQSQIKLGIDKIGGGFSSVLGELQSSSKVSKDLSVKVNSGLDSIGLAINKMNNDVSNIKGSYKNIEQFIPSVLEELKDSNNTAKEISDKFSNGFDSIGVKINKMNDDVSVIKGSSQSINKFIPDLNKSLENNSKVSRGLGEAINIQQDSVKKAIENLNKNIKNMSDSTRSFNEVSLALNETIENMNDITRENLLSSAGNYESLGKLLSSHDANVEKAALQFVAMKDLLAEMVKSQSDMVSEISGIRYSLKGGEDSADLSKLVLGLTDAVNEMNKKKDNKLFDFFSKEKDGEG